ncbi:unnamed protein product [Protopolystoma xenopodis]|uniref:EF-hand domain-containing protein n=1 Tax=Protopolystoma xenopodis TaxID=117903 RepID=A0A3S5FDP3_9PLAT|nr:unnamed protein product [Protopolystoma xenopodis]
MTPRELSDVDCDGQLTLSEFNVAMHLVVLRRVNLPIPDRLPGSLARLATSTCHLSSTGPLPRPPMCSQSVDTIGANSSSATEPQRSEEEMLTNPLSPALSVGQTATGPLFPPSSLLPPPLPPAPPSLAQSEVSAFSTPVSDFLVVGSVGTDPIRSSFLPSWNPKVGCLEATVPTAFSRIANDTVVSLSEDRVSLGPGVVDDRPWSVSSSLQSDVVSLAEGMPRFDSRLAHDDFVSFFYGYALVNWLVDIPPIKLSAVRFQINNVRFCTRSLFLYSLTCLRIL